jgi:hypothetical protein
MVDKKEFTIIFLKLLTNFDFGDTYVDNVFVITDGGYERFVISYNNDGTYNILIEENVCDIFQDAFGLDYRGICLIIGELFSELFSIEVDATDWY